MKILLLSATALVLGLLTGCAVGGPDGGYVGASPTGITVDPPGPAGVTVGAPQ